jgi:hypothetical protein
VGARGTGDKDREATRRYSPIPIAKRAAARRNADIEHPFACGHGDQLGLIASRDVNRRAELFGLADGVCGVVDEFPSVPSPHRSRCRGSLTGPRTRLEARLGSIHRWIPSPGVVLAAKAVMSTRSVLRRLPDGWKWVAGLGAPAGAR